jgi:hypothetical protein
MLTFEQVFFYRFGIETIAEPKVGGLNKLTDGTFKIL